jgi:hypothetical protein
MMSQQEITKMKFIVVLILTISFQSALGGRREEALRRQLDETSEKRSIANITKLADAIAINYRFLMNKSHDDLLILDQVREEFLRIPGHAQILADEIERLRRMGEHTTTARTKYILETLPHLPSPEAIQVLGRYLSDDRDVPPPRLPNQDWTTLPQNSFLAVDALGRIGLRNAPETKFFAYKDQAVLDAAQTWWREIESGRKTFSFKGQAVEHRFKPDGTWETLSIANPPDDGPKPLAAVLPSRSEVPPGSSESTSSQTMNKPWPWILIAMIGGLVLVIWGGLRRVTGRI